MASSRRLAFGRLISCRSTDTFSGWYHFSFIYYTMVGYCWVSYFITFHSVKLITSSLFFKIYRFPPVFSFQTDLFRCRQERILR
ncbi:hypothetical protein ASPFODRAFT_568112 [Aspergillus luchuensis CBS 106.47]|uniref:Uncharacterized protein n=1 Tax=Aspergillus luchuensis (strain CBS 106.47) TaxID=1137211 RepID=A0A1M3TL03_ASPLC|nr:hypothetical protein ASPFODRAFT_568112 [Aspergillus luchuensis CBS 106.47]